MLCTCLRSTILLGKNQISMYFGLSPPTLDEFLAPREYLGAEVSAESLPAIEKVDDLIDNDIPPPQSTPRYGTTDDDVHPEDAELRLPDSPADAESSLRGVHEMLV